MRSLDLYSEKQFRDGSPDKIAASTAFVREATSLSLASLAQDTKNTKDLKDAADLKLAKDQRDLKDAKDTKDTKDPKDAPTAPGSAQLDQKKGLLSLFNDSPETNKVTMTKGQRDKVLRAAGAVSNPLSLFSMSEEAVSPQGFTLRELQVLADQSVVNERMQRVIARQNFLLKEAKVKDEKGGEGAERMNDTTIMSSAAAAAKKIKMFFVKDKVSIAKGITRPERNLQPKHPRDQVKQNKLLKKKQMLVDYLEKFRGKLSLQEVSEVISQMEKLDKALLLMAT